MEKIKVSRLQRVDDLPGIRFEIDLDLDLGTAFIQMPNGSGATEYDISCVGDVGRAVIEWLRDRGCR